MNAVDGNPSTTSSVESGYATLSTVPAFLGDSVEGIDSVDMTARESSVVAGEPELQSMFWGFGIDGALTACARRLATSDPKLKCPT